QQIYTAAELGEAGIITSIDFYCTANNTYARNFDIYMVSTSKSSFESTTDWINVTTGDLVYSGSVTLTAGWNTFEIDGFEYDGTSNVAIIVDANATDYENGIGFYVFTPAKANQAIYVYSDGTNYDPLNPPTATGVLSVKNQLRLTKEPLPPCSKPTGFAVTEVTNHTATFSWTSDADAWQLCINGDEANPIPVTTNPYTLTGLDAETTYTVKLRANCGGEDGVSFWTGEVRFTTEIACPAPTALTVVPVDPNSVNVSWEGSANGYEMQYANVAGGVSGLYNFAFEEDLEGWTNLIVNEEQGEWLHSSEQPYGYDYTTIAHGGTGFAMCYSFIDYTGSFETDAYLVSPMNYAINEGASMNFWYDMANDDYPEYFEVCVATVANPTAEDFTAIWSWSEAKATLDPSRKVPMGRSDMRHINRTRYNNWREVTIDLSDYVGQSIWIAFHDVNYDMYEVWIDDLTIDAGTSSEINWIPVGAVTSPYLLDGLEEGTPYLLRVRAVCGGIDGESVWVNTTFTTPTFCDTPFALNVPFETLMPTTATLAWTGYQDGFEVRYRPTVSYDPIIEETFENGIPSTWTLINNDEDEYNWLAISDIPATYSYYAEMDLSGWAHNGSDAAVSASYVNGIGALNTDQYLVSPQLTLNGSLRFFATSTYTDPDTYEVLLSTTGTDIADFTITLQEMGPATYNSWDEVVIDMSEYAGQQGYIAIHHVANDKYFLVIDDFGLYNVVENDWTTVSTDAQFVDIEDLDPETEYEWQVRGEHRGCTNGEEEGYTPWSVMGTFTTPGLCDPFARITIDTVTATSITLSWLGYQESYNVRYRTPADADEVFYDDFSEYEDIDGDDYITLADTDWTGSNLNDDEEQPSDIYTLNFTDGTSMTVFGFAGNGTDQYLISPEFEVENAGILEFYYLAYQASTQTFQVGFSSTDNALTSFTWSEAFTNGTEDYTDYYQIEVPAGTKYFAIKSSGESGLLLLSEFYVGDNYVPASEWIVFEGVTDNPYTITGLTPNTLYQVQIQGNCTETSTTDWYGGYFVTPDAQIIALAQGSNWFSTNREITLADLQTALRTALPNAANRSIKITSQNSGYSQNLGNNWNGQLKALDVAQMYMITVPSACEITLEGEPIDPAEHPVNIVVGSNWIGFPLQEVMTLNNAFAGFGTAGDIVKSQTNGQATKRGNAWMGQLKNLVPGKGYIYNASAIGTLTFPSNTSKGAKTSSLSKTSRLNHDKVFAVPTSLTKVQK
ncbi:MAG: choice-of-anchor J domain-containing protein, partial [Muribaculaceae bacterium]|nr:choice-of-anchor J domain-containing protein [Muribaculaceae bacterium]